MTMLAKMFGAARAKARSLEGVLGRATEADGARELADRELAATAVPPLYKHMKQLPKLEPWQRELVPWANGAVEYAERYGSMARDIRFWRLAVFVVVAAAVARDVQQQRSIQKLAERPRAEAYMFETCNGSARSMLTAERVPDPDEERIRAAIGRWVDIFRSSVEDSGENAAHMKQVFAMVSKGTPAHTAVTKWYADHNPYAPVTQRVEVRMFPPRRVGASNRFEVEWVERTTRIGSTQAEEAQYRQYVTYALSRSSRYEDLVANLFGIYVTEFTAPSRLR